MARPYSIAAVVLLAIGTAQMLGDVARLPIVEGVAAASAASPAPKVFSAVRGYETYSTRFFVEWVDPAGANHSLELTPRTYSRIGGPYNRRNVYGAVVAYGPVLVSNPETRPLWESVARYAMCGEAPLLRELGIETDEVAGPPAVRYVPLAGTEVGDLPMRLEAPCP